MTSQEVTFSSGEITTNRDHTSNLCMLGLCLVVLGFFFLRGLPQLSLLLGVARLHTCSASVFSSPGPHQRRCRIGGEYLWYCCAQLLGTCFFALWLLGFSGDFLVSVGVWVTDLLPVCLQPTSRLALSCVFPSSTHQPLVLSVTAINIVFSGH